MKTPAFSVDYKSPLGPLRISGRGNGISGITMAASRAKSQGRMPARVRKSLDLYFKGRADKGARFLLEGTPFQRSVWNALASIPWGESISYAELARRVKRPKAVRAVASAVGANPVAILVPCHRVIGSDGSLTGYAYGLKKKSWLLAHEKGGRG